MMRADKWAERCDELVTALLPALRYRAASCGYAIGVHGSMRHDIDLIAAPWRAAPVEAAYLIEELAKVVAAVCGGVKVLESSKKPCGRLSTCIYPLDVGEWPYFDISVMPAVEALCEDVN
jgi:hypothetical protein